MSAMPSMVMGVVAALLFSTMPVVADAQAHASKAQRHATRKPLPAIKRTSVAAAPATVDYARRADVQAFIDELVETRGFVRGELLQLFGDAQYSPVAARLMTPGPGGTRRDWPTYRARFVEPLRIAAGVRFWDENAASLQRAEDAYGVPASIIVGILGVETIYGRNTGSFRVLDVLTTLAFDYPNKQRDRSGFFREQLADALVLARDSGADIHALKGSYAGAIGMPQFMPGSILHYAVDFDGDGVVDLVGSPADVIGSVANFLAQHGWVRGLPTHVVLGRGSSDDPLQEVATRQMVEAGSVPSLGLADLSTAGFVSETFPPDATLALIDLPGGSDGGPAVAYLAGTQNFHTITRYNRSYFYAYSVIELGRAVAEERRFR